MTGFAAGLLFGCSDPSSPDASSPSLATTLSSPTLTVQHSGTTQRLQAVSTVNRNIVWASGTGGTYTVTRDGGATWHAAVVPGAAALEFRDVEGITGQEAYLLAAGVGTDSRIYHTSDGGNSWQIQFKNQDPNGFYDCFAFWTEDRALVMADAINGRFPVRRTLDGRFWVDIGDNLPRGPGGGGSLRRERHLRGHARREQRLDRDRRRRARPRLLDHRSGEELAGHRAGADRAGHRRGGRLLGGLPRHAARRDRRRRLREHGAGAELRGVRAMAGRPGSTGPTRRSTARSSG